MRIKDLMRGRERDLCNRFLYNCIALLENLPVETTGEMPKQTITHHSCCMVLRPHAQCWDFAWDPDASRSELELSFHGHLHADRTARRT